MRRLIEEVEVMSVIMKRFQDQLIDQSQMERELDAARVAAYK